MMLEEWGWNRSLVSSPTSEPTREQRFLHRMIQFLPNYLAPPRHFPWLVYENQHAFRIASLEERHYKFVRQMTGGCFYFRVAGLYPDEGTQPDTFFFTELRDYTLMRLRFSDAHLVSTD